MRPLALGVATVVGLGVVGGGVAVAGHGGDSSARAARTASISLRAADNLGRIVVDSKGRTLYLFEKDKTTRSRCYGQCAAAWPPALVKGRATAGAGLSARKLGTTKRRNGARQLTYGGHPLYRFIQDANQPGSTKGQQVDAFGAEWYVVGKRGRKVGK
jgi:predicted lipoprotein with Yx(FWY)xxD motif